ncbi:ribonuclease D [Desulfotalea psychrophila]|uniref:Ribonuclease D n=1 Tax=Desulfotalea psychrophila (strain LSv54 / DSM 12343) TaxID=177439 RepID=RND_DESPS|nr:ribonuclease D [Desulfotalea psychrophila]Q6AJF4.1 RecName: Full=Ribonuclease D; Short=RNase D [Desulfotalea psychrophila LSv54]CAG37526.1 related to ribonuclease D [Desulfotalea psychrophila LSv54]
MKQENIISTTEDLKKIVNKALKLDAVGLDTEFVWERTYYPQLGLIQIALSDEECYAIDPLSIKDLSPLGELLADRNTIKILHDAPQDLIIMSQATGATPQNIFDTRLAAGFAGSISTISLLQLVSEQLETELDKSETRTNWLKRPLTEKQLSYSLNDVRYLRATRVILLSKIIGPKIKSWLQEELNLLNNPANYSTIADESRYKKVKGVNKLDRKSIGVAQEIATWREQKARELNRPRGHVIKDDILLEIAAIRPTRPEELANTAISTKAAERYGNDICQATARALNKKEVDLPHQQKRSQLSSQEKGALAQLKELITLKCDILGIDPALLGNSNELKKIIQTLYKGKTTHMRQSFGWRKEFLKDFYQIHRDTI